MPGPLCVICRCNPSRPHPLPFVCGVLSKPGRPCHCVWCGTAHQASAPKMLITGGTAVSATWEKTTAASQARKSPPDHLTQAPAGLLPPHCTLLPKGCGACISNLWVTDKELATACTSSGSCQEAQTQAEMKVDGRGDKHKGLELVSLGLRLGSATVQLCYLQQVTGPPVPNLLLCQMWLVTAPAHWGVCGDRMK